MSELRAGSGELNAEARAGAGTAEPRGPLSLEGFPLVAAVVVVYAWLFAWFPALRSPNELSRLYQTRAIVNSGALPIEAEILRRGPVGDLAVHGGHYYAAKAPGISLIGVPIYAALVLARGGDRRVSDRAGIYFLRLFGCAIPAAIAVEAMRRILARRLERRLAAAGAALLALGTLVWPYATQLASHATATAAILACWDGLDRARETRRARYVCWAGFAAGTAVLLEYTSAMYLLPLAGYALVSSTSRWRVAALASAGAVVPLAALLAFHRSAFGGMLANPYSFLANPVYAGWHAPGLFGIGPPRMGALARSFLDPAHGLFAYAPFLALGVVGIPALWRRDRSMGAVCAVATLLAALFTAGFETRAWGWSVGPRHLTPLCAFLLPPALVSAEKLRRQGLSLVPAVLAAYSVIVLGVIVAVCPYLPDDLGNPLHQLVLPLAREGLHVADLAQMAFGRRTWWTLLPWAAALALVAAPAHAARRRDPPPLRRVAVTAPAGRAAGVLVVALSALGGPDRFGSTRALLRAVYEPAGARVANLFDPP